MKQIRGILLFIVLISPSFVSEGQEIYDLKQCLELGLERNYAIRIVRNEQEIANNNATAGNAGYLPTVDLSAGYAGTKNNIEQETVEGTTNKYNNINNQLLNAGINLNWTIFDGFQIQAKYERLQELQQMGSIYTRLTIEEFIADFSTEYYNHVRQKIRLANLKYAVGLSRERLRIAEAQYVIGSKSRLDMQQAYVDFNADSSNLVKQHEILYASRTRLNQLMALDDVASFTLISDSVIQYNSLLNKGEIWEKTLESNASLLLSEKEKQLSELDYKAAKSRNYPYLKLNGGYGYTQNLYGMGNYEKQQSLGFNYGLTLGFNLFDGMNRKREQKNARLQIQNKDLQSKQLELELKTNLSNIWMAYENNLQLTGLEKENLKAAKESYEIAIDRYKLGDLSGIELREVQTSLLAAEERLLQAQYNTKVCEISLLQISGQITNYLNKR